MRWSEFQAVQNSERNRFCIFGDDSTWFQDFVMHVVRHLYGRVQRWPVLRPTVFSFVI